jgi:hypothetical protein
VAVEFAEDAFTPLEAQSLALHVAAALEGEGYRVQPEQAYDQNAPFRTTIHASFAGLVVLVEVQRAPACTAELRELAGWLDHNRIYAQLYVAVEASDDAPLSGRMLQQLRRLGVGLLLVDLGGHVETSMDARNPALIVTPDPTLALGGCRAEVGRCIQRFNNGDRKGALQEMFEMVERETRNLGLRAARKGWIDRPESAVEAMDWSNTINVLASATRVAPGKTVLMDSKLKDDLQSFRGARNLVDHPPRNKRADVQRQRQFSERMMSGPRLVSELLSLRRKIT